MSKESFNIREDGENTFWKIIDEHNQKYRDQINRQWTEIAKQAWESVEKIKDLKVFIGDVYEREIDYGNDLEFITETLNEVLNDFVGKKVKITIEVIS